MNVLESFSAGQVTLTTQKSVCDTTATGTPKQSRNASKPLSEGSKLKLFLGASKDYGLCLQDPCPSSSSPNPRLNPDFIMSA